MAFLHVVCISHNYIRSVIWMLALRFWTGRHFSGHACLRAALQAPSGAGKWSRPCKSRTENLSTFLFVGCVFCQRGCFQTAPFSVSQRKIHRRRSCGLGKACRLHTLTLTSLTFVQVWDLFWMGRCCYWKVKCPAWRKVQETTGKGLS